MQDDTRLGEPDFAETIRSEAARRDRSAGLGAKALSQPVWFGTAH